MLRMKHTYLAVMAALLAPWAAQAQQPAAAPPAPAHAKEHTTPTAPASMNLNTLSKVVAYAIVNNPEVRARYQDFASSVEGQNVARGPMLPQVNANVFPGVKNRPITTDAAMKLLKELRPGLTAHGFRSTFRDWAAETTSHPREIIEQAMAHRLKDAAEAAYQRGDLLVRRAVLMKDWAGYCAAPRKADNVTALQGRKHRAKAR